MLGRPLRQRSIGNLAAAATVPSLVDHGWSPRTMVPAVPVLTTCTIVDGGPRGTGQPSPVYLENFLLRAV